MRPLIMGDEVDVRIARGCAGLCKVDWVENGWFGENAKRDKRDASRRHQMAFYRSRRCMSHDKEDGQISCYMRLYTSLSQQVSAVPLLDCSVCSSFGF